MNRSRLLIAMSGIGERRRGGGELLADLREQVERHAVRRPSA